ncbi:MAG: 1-deoxy-D-xylulose-5-phosphate synthase, partial [Deltaproteobacteria bacterium]|nr:1-deoxy-D-xylulose-5-phosphate synthase [Deltaproteobacteria bacterium]
HAGTSISAAVGMATALKDCDPKRYVVAVIGDGAMTCGMGFEALNHAGELGLNNLIVILNDNEMSISPNVGAISWFFSRSITAHTPTRARSKFKSLYHRGYIPEVVYKAIDRVEEVTQGAISGASMLFEAFGFRYIGPVDGHNIDDLLKALTNAKRQDVPVLVHARTIKGKGYQPAEINPVAWHGVSPFKRESGQFQVKAVPPGRKSPLSYTEVFSRSLLKLARHNSKIVAITAAMPTGTGLDRFQKEFPDRFYDVGICEDHAVTFAAGLACEGYRPVCAIYSSFLQRGYDQILHDVCIQKLPVVFALDRSGVVGEDGETHQGVFDVAYLRSLPNMTIMAPSNEIDLQNMLYTAFLQNGPVAIRYPRGASSGLGLARKFYKLKIGEAEIVKNGADLLFICLGPMVNHALAAAKRLKCDLGISSTIINARFAKPLDQALLLQQIPRHSLVCTIEDHTLAGGFGSGVLEMANDHGLVLQQPIFRFGVGDQFVPHATQAQQHCSQKYDPESIYQFVAEKLASRKLAAVPLGRTG